MDSEDEAADVESDDSDNGPGSPVRLEYETDPQSISITGNVDTVADNVNQEGHEGEAGEFLDVGEGGKGVGVIESTVQNSEDSDSHMAMEGVAVVAEPSTDDSVSYSIQC
jgi:hypothetical protein